LSRELNVGGYSKARETYVARHYQITGGDITGGLERYLRFDERVTLLGLQFKMTDGSSIKS